MDECTHHQSYGFFLLNIILNPSCLLHTSKERRQYRMVTRHVASRIRLTGGVSLFYYLLIRQQWASYITQIYLNFLCKLKPWFLITSRKPTSLSLCRKPFIVWLPPPHPSPHSQGPTDTLAAHRSPSPVPILLHSRKSVLFSPSGPCFYLGHRDYSF
jgi:hypothetical protein